MARLTSQSIVLLTIIFISSLGEASQFIDLGSEKIRVLTPEECRQDFTPSPKWFRPQTRITDSKDSRAPYFWTTSQRPNGAGPWAPDGTSEYLEPLDCSPDHLERTMLSARGSVNSQKDVVDKYFGACETRLRKNGSNTAMADMIFTKYEICDHPGIRKVIMKLKNGSVLRGILGVKPGERRPLVIGKGGVFADLGDTSHRFLSMHLFDESPFHVLLLNNTTGSEAIVDNERLAVGGIEEGHQIIQAAELIKRTALRNRISEVHVVSVSLGGGGALYSSAINDRIAQSHGKNLISSTLSLCPVVDLQASFEGVFKDEIVEPLGRALYEETKFNVLKRNRKLESLFPPSDILSSEIPDYFVGQSVDFWKRRGTEWLLPPFTNTRMDTPTNFWSANDFSKYAEKRRIRTPTFVLSSQDDPIVKTTPNTSKLASAIATYIERNGVNSTAVATTTVPKGGHCAISRLYGWRVVSAILRSYVVSRSPSLIARRWRAESRLPKGLYEHPDAKLGPDEAYYMARFELKPDDPTLYIKQEIFTKVNDACTGFPLTKSQRHCRREAVLKMPLDKLTHRPPWWRKPRTEAESESLTRWANANLRLVDKLGKSINESREPGASIRFISYE